MDHTGHIRFQKETAVYPSDATSVGNVGNATCDSLP